jgi:hypothetical protein
MPRNRYVGRQSDVGSGSGWIIAGVIVVVLLGVAAYSVHDTQVSSSSTPGTTTGQSSRPPVPSTPPAAPVAPASRPQQQP